MAKNDFITIERHVLEQQKQFPHATGELANLLYDIALCGKAISREVNKAGLVDILGMSGDTKDMVKKCKNWMNLPIRSLLILTTIPVVCVVWRQRNVKS
jgi:fructose-1,6-bisphosphatase I